MREETDEKEEKKMGECLEKVNSVYFFEKIAGSNK
jgi:hypothetical protein